MDHHIAPNPLRIYYGNTSYYSRQYIFKVQSTKRMGDRRQSTSATCFVVLVCLGAVVAQTFQYSRGWTNGKKRAGGAVPQVFQQPFEGNDVLGICQMLRLKEILAQKKRDQVVLPCEVLMESDEDTLNRFRRKVAEYYESPSLEQQGSTIRQDEPHS